MTIAFQIYNYMSVGGRTEVDVLQASILIRFFLNSSGLTFPLFYKIGKYFQTSIVNIHNILSLASDQFRMIGGESLKIDQH